MGKKEYMQANKDWLAEKAKEEGVMPLSKGIYYKVLASGKNDGKLKKLGDLRIVSQDGDYKLIYAVLAVCALAIVAALAVSSIAYYGLWVLAIGTFLLAVYYTVKMM